MFLDNNKNNAANFSDPETQNMVSFQKEQPARQNMKYICFFCFFVWAIFA
jgi:hypothetical protein